MPQEFAHTRSSSQKQDTDEQLNDVSMAAQAETDAAADALDACKKAANDAAAA